MSNFSDIKLPLQVMINKEKTKVLFAEANIDFTNVLLSFLACPLGEVVKRVISLGSLNTLYTGLYNMDESYFSGRGAKQMLLKPQSSFRDELRKLALDITDSLPYQIYVCSDRNCPQTGYKNVSLYPDMAMCDCGRWLNREIRVPEPVGGGAFVTNPSSFIITDDLRVVPVLSSLFQTLGNLGITDTQGAELRSLMFDINEIRELFKFCFTSATPLTEMIIKKTKVRSIAAKPELGISLHHIPKQKAHSREMVLKVSLQKSTNKFLFAEATDKFIEVLFSFLVVPIGAVEFLLGGDTGFIGLDNLYRSVSNDMDDKCFTSLITKRRLIHPNLPCDYFSYNDFLPLSNEWAPDLSYNTDDSDPVIKNTSFDRNNFRFRDFKSGKKLSVKFKSSERLSVKRHTKCIVTDDLTVHPSLAMTIMILNNLGIPLSDVKETELRIGLEEALRILKASLTSKTVLTDALIKPMLNKLPNI